MWRGGALRRFYLYADEASREVLLSQRQKVLLIGGDTGNANFGDVLQAVNSINSVHQSQRFATVCIMVAHAISFQQFPVRTREAYGADAILFVADYPLIFDKTSPSLERVIEIRNIAAVHLYGGGFLNSMWGDYVLDIAEYFLQLVPDVTYIVSGQQITAPFQRRVVDHIRQFKPALFGVRDEYSQHLMRVAGFDGDFSFDDATETLQALTQALPLRRGAGLLLHVNSSYYTSNDTDMRTLGCEIGTIEASRWSREGITLLQAFRDPRQEVCDTRETLKKLDVFFPFTDFRLIELASLAYGNRDAALVRPLMGEIGYSCSYHVTLWLHLAGIPCWLRSSNAFYDQKSRALQVSQTLNSFLVEPLLADHRFDLERRAMWNQRFQGLLLQIPDVFRSITIPCDGQGPAPWIFLYKGRATPQEKQKESDQSNLLKLNIVTAAECTFDMVEDEDCELLGRIDALTMQLTELGNEVHRQRNRAEAAEHVLGVVRGESGQLLGRVEALTAQFASILASRSWRLTRGLRVVGRFLRERTSLHHE